MGSDTEGMLPEPEALLISALIDSGEYLPSSYGITDGYFISERNIHNWCTDYQKQAGRAPELSLLVKKYSSFPYCPNVNPKWAAKLLYEKWANKMLHEGMRKAAEALSADEPMIGDVIEHLSATVKSVRPRASKPMTITDYDMFSADTDDYPCPVVAGNLQALTGGIKGGDLWYIAARLGEGKSWRLIQHAIAAAEGGWDVAFFSLEMPAKQVVDRLHRLILKDWKKPWYEMDSTKRKDLIGEWQSKGNGSISVFDPSSGRCDPSVVAGTVGPKTLAIIDYVGLMYTTSGSRSIDDWRAAATVSNQLKEVAISQSVPIISAAQINRSGDSTTGNGVPRTANLAQTDALGQDADLVLTMRRYSKRVLTNGVVKYRHGQSGAKWYTRFEPHIARLEEITPEQALDYKAVDDSNDTVI